MPEPFPPWDTGPAREQAVLMRSLISEINSEFAAHLKPYGIDAESVYTGSAPMDGTGDAMTVGFEKMLRNLRAIPLRYSERDTYAISG